MLTLERLVKFKSHVHSMRSGNRLRIFIRILPELFADLDKNFKDGECLNVTIKADNKLIITFLAVIMRINRNKKVNKNYRIEIPSKYHRAIQNWMYERESILIVLKPFYPN